MTSTEHTRGHDHGYTLDASREAEARIAQDLAQLSTALPGELGSSCLAVSLIGTYARGEGSVITRNGELHAGSPYELVVVMAKHGPLESSALAAIEEAWRGRLEVDLRLHPITPAQLGHVNRTLTWVDACAGGIETLAGDGKLIERLPVQSADELPAERWATMLRDAALGLAGCHLDATLNESQRLAKIHHAFLLAGDAALLGFSRYASDMRKRRSELAYVERELELEGLCAAYTDALHFQTRPDAWHMSESFTSREHFHGARTALVKALHLKLEAKRVGTPLDALGYALHEQKLWADTRFRPWNALKRTLRAAREGERTLHAERGDAHERLARCAVLLGYASERPEARRLAARLLGITHDDERTPREDELMTSLQHLADTTRDDDDPLARARYGRP